MDPASGVSVDASPVLANLPTETQSLVSAYFDTPDHELRAAGFALRIRRQGRKRIQTVKAEGAPAAGLFVRSEWEHAVPGDVPVFTIDSGPLPNVFATEQLARIEHIFTTRISRSVRTIEVGDAQIEVAIDTGAIEWDGKAAPVREIELELKSGASTAIFALAKALAVELPLRLGVQSKAERGFDLIKAPPGKSKRADVRLQPDGSTADAFATIAMACLRHYRLNETAVISAGDVSALHQARVALRQLRTAIWLFDPLFEGDAQAGRLRAAVKDLARRFGEVRNIDVLIPRTRGEPRKGLEAARSDALRTLQQALHDPSVRLLMIELAEWVTIGAWRTPPKPASGANGLFAAHALDRVRKRLKRKGKALARLDPATRHRARIEAKRLRYATEFFASLYPGKKAQRRLRAFRLALAELQDVLGELNDREMAPLLFARLGLQTPLPTLKGEKAARLMRAAEDAYDALFDTKPFWRA
jgi:triphosphatase